jgi:hypothetical protein
VGDALETLALFGMAALALGMVAPTGGEGETT